MHSIAAQEIVRFDGHIARPNSAALLRRDAHAQTAESLDPNLPLVHAALASIYLFRRQLDKALAASNRWLEIEPVK